MFIGELARSTGVSPKAIRFYEAAGLLPEPRRSEGGYRLYPPEAIDRLRFVRRAQGLGLKLAEIKEIVRHSRDGPPCDYVAELAREKVSHLNEEIERLRQTRERLVELVGQLEESCCQPAGPPLSLICPCLEATAPQARP